MRKKAARHYKPNYKHELIHLFECEAEVMLEEKECPLCDGDGRVPKIDAAQKNIHETMNLLTIGEPEYGGKIVIDKRYENDVWKINQSMATVDLKTVGVRSGGLEKNGKKSHCVKEHPAAFPVELPRAVMNFLTAPGETVLDVFGGSGSTLIACEQLGRRARLVEFDPQYVDLIVRRWQDFTGQRAVRESDGMEFPA
jgi:DNA modification methylase